MKFLQLKDETAIAIDNIRMIKKSGDFSCKVQTSSDIYEVDIPYITLMSMLEAKDEAEDRDILQRMYNIMKTMGTSTP